MGRAYLGASARRSRAGFLLDRGSCGVLVLYGSKGGTLRPSAVLLKRLLLRSVNISKGGGDEDIDEDEEDGTASRRRMLTSPCAYLLKVP